MWKRHWNSMVVSRLYWFCDWLLDWSELLWSYQYKRAQLYGVHRFIKKREKDKVEVCHQKYLPFVFFPVHINSWLHNKYKWMMWVMFEESEDDLHKCTMAVSSQIVLKHLNYDKQAMNKEKCRCDFFHTVVQ